MKNLTTTQKHPTASISGVFFMGGNNGVAS